MNSHVASLALICLDWVSRNASFQYKGSHRGNLGHGELLWWWMLVSLDKVIRKRIWKSSQAPSVWVFLSLWKTLLSSCEYWPWSTFYKHLRTFAGFEWKTASAVGFRPIQVGFIGRIRFKRVPWCSTLCWENFCVCQADRCYGCGTPWVTEHSSTSCLREGSELEAPKC